MDAISSYKKQFKEASNCLSNDKNELLHVEQELASLLEKKDKLERKIEMDRQNKFEKGMLYYSGNRRDSLLDRAKELRYSENAINRLKSIDDQHWNPDYVDKSVIEDFESIEQFVDCHTPRWEKSLMAKFGKWINDNEQE